MNENEIIKALEHCIFEEVQGCIDCPLLEFSPDCNKCQTELMKQALDLIKRKDADLKQKDTEIDILIRKNETLKDEVAELRAEVERVQKELDIMRFITAKRWVKEAKSEARKEFADKLKERAILRCFDPMFGVKIAFSEADIDNLLAEMESETE